MFEPLRDDILDSGDEGDEVLLDEPLPVLVLVAVLELPAVGGRIKEVGEVAQLEAELCVHLGVVDDAVVLIAEGVLRNGIDLLRA